MKILVGYTGFVGQNLLAKGDFGGLFNSKNITDAFGSQPDLLVYAGVSGTKFMANHEPEKDYQAKVEALDNIKRINPKRLVLISSVDVYRNPVNVTEDTPNDIEANQTYGYTRALLERWVIREFPGTCTVRLPGLYGQGLKKNFIYDFIYLVPPMLTNEKYRELCMMDDFIKPFYRDLGNGYLACEYPDRKIFQKLREYFLKIKFTAKNFSDSRGIYQYYNLAHLWDHLQTALASDIKVLNIVTEPFSLAEMCEFINGERFENHMQKPLVHYDVRTKHAHLFGREGCYLLSKGEVLQDLKQYIRAEQTRFGIQTGSAI